MINEVQILEQDTDYITANPSEGTVTLKVNEMLLEKSPKQDSDIVLNRILKKENSYSKFSKIVNVETQSKGETILF